MKHDAGSIGYKSGWCRCLIRSSFNWKCVFLSRIFLCASINSASVRVGMPWEGCTFSPSKSNHSLGSTSLSSSTIILCMITQALMINASVSVSQTHGTSRWSRCKTVTRRNSCERDPCACETRPLHGFTKKIYQVKIVKHLEMPFLFPPHIILGVDK